MATPAQFYDQNGELRLDGTLVGGGGGSPSSHWTIGADGSLIIADTAASADFADLFNLLVAGGAVTLFSSDSSGNATWAFLEDGSNWKFNSGGADVPGTILVIREYDVNFVGNAVPSLFKVDRENNMLGFFNHAPAAQQVLSSGTATPEQIAQALQANGFCGGT